MYKYYSLERPVSIGTYPKNPKNKLLAFENFEKDNQCVKQLVRDNDMCFNAWGYLLFEKPLTDKEIKDYELGDAGEVNRFTKVTDLPRNLQDEIMGEINNSCTSFKKGTNKIFRMNREAFLDIYGSFSLDDFQKMMPKLSKKYSLISEKDKSPLEKLMDGNLKYESILDTLEAKQDTDCDYSNIDLC